MAEIPSIKSNLDPLTDAALTLVEHDMEWDRKQTLDVFKEFAKRDISIGEFACFAATVLDLNGKVDHSVDRRAVFIEGARLLSAGVSAEELTEGFQEGSEARMYAEIGEFNSATQSFKEAQDPALMKVRLERVSPFYDPDNPVHISPVRMRIFVDGGMEDLQGERIANNMAEHIESCDACRRVKESLESLKSKAA